jgi:hypothetical protein
MLQEEKNQKTLMYFTTQQNASRVGPERLRLFGFLLRRFPGRQLLHQQ